MDSKNLLISIQRWLHFKNKTPIEELAIPPVSVELFNADQIERHGITLALAHTDTQLSTKNKLLSRLTDCEATLRKTCKLLGDTPGDSFSPASEWLLDNFYLIQEQIHAIRRHLPKEYGNVLPKLTHGNLQGYPRVYDIALDIIRHGDGRWDLESLSRFIANYQTVAKLTLGELWAIPIMLGVALIENLSNVSNLIVADRNDRVLADHWADSMVEVAITEPKKLVLVIAEMARSEPPMSSAFVAELVRRLQGAAMALPLSWLEQHLADEGLTIEHLVQEEYTYQAANQVTVSNSVASLRRLTEVDWRNFVEKMSIVDQALRMDPTADYSKMDFGTRDRYRHVIERLSRASQQSEEAVALCSIQLAKNKLAIQLAGQSASQDRTRENHVGFYLIGKGLIETEKALGIRHFFWQTLFQTVHRFALVTYLGCITLITSGLVYALLHKAIQSDLSTSWLWIIGIALAVYGSHLAVGLVNLAATLVVKPELLPRMDFSKGIPAAYRSLVVVPAMLSSRAGIESLVEALEVRFLGNRDTYLHFMLLTDFNDAHKQHMPEDEELLNLAQQLILALNTKYSQTDSDIFFLCHRPRQWNVRENVWMGRERKRGKLTDLNNLLRGNGQSNFLKIIGRTEILASIKYVITLDIDTQLPRESAREFIGTMAHPLNRPYYDSLLQRVVDGYGILQPRVGEAWPFSGVTRYLRLCGNDFGIDPYTCTVSDIYQDLFQEGSFIGKGIYDVDLFQQVLAERFQENHILSHDLLEGCYLRSGFLSDVTLYEESPGSYLADAKRHSRWIRGDWQLIGWLLPWVRNANNKRVANHLSFLSKWKLFDNLRRSLVPIALLILFGLSWTILPPTHFWLSIIFIIVIMPAVVKMFLELVRKPSNMLPSQHLTTIIQAGYQSVGQLILYLACLPYEAWYTLRAILVTCFRLFFTKRHLLEWTSSDQVNQHLHNMPLKWIATMWVSPVAAIIALFCLVVNGRTESILFAAPLLMLWLVSPLLTYWLSRPFQRVEPKLDSSQLRFLHKMARKTWGFFETFITAENNWLPPDNFQEVPVAVLARRTSPTNIGLSLLTNLTAHDFGYITLQQLLTRTTNALQTILKLERYRGHLYNWYDTETLVPLLPRYISTVDSGNLAGHLLTLRQGLLSLPNEPLLSIRYLDGLIDTFEVLTENLNKNLPTELKIFQRLLFDSRLIFMRSWLDAAACAQNLLAVAEQIFTLSSAANSPLQTMAGWSNKLVAQCRELHTEINLFSQIPNLPAHITLHGVSLLDSTQSVSIEVNSRLAAIKILAQQAFSLAQMDISFLYDQASHLMVIGFNVDTQQRDSSSYDLLSSEARLASFVSIAQGQVLQESWFALGRLLVSRGKEPILISWSGSMFEYLMPLLVMPNYPGTLLDQTYQAVVRRQIEYGRQHGVPWGVSESGFNAVDTQFNYLYRAFGVPDLGLKRGLEDDLVIAPYASALALMVAPEVACSNLQRLADEYAVGEFGFYEAIDFTLARLPPDRQRILVRSFMAHHQGMSLLAFSYLLHDQPMQQRFVADPLFQSALLLLQERIPKPTADYLQIPKSLTNTRPLERPEASVRVFNTPNTRTPQVQLLSNGRYHVVLTQAGGGYSRWKDIAVTRWREDSTCDDWGLFSYVRDVETGEFWSTTYQPTLIPADSFKSVFSEAHAEFTRTDNSLHLHTEVAVSPEDDVELRRLRIHNRSKSRRTIELTSYGEIVLAPQAADLAQPAFNNLFVETEILPEQHAILATRRAQDPKDEAPWLCHLLNVYSETNTIISFETDRAQFVGRGRTLALPLAMMEAGELSNTKGAVLDPIMSIRCRITLLPNTIVIFDLITGVSDTRSHCLELVEKYQDRYLANRIFGLAWTHGQVLLHHLNISEADAQLYGKLASAIIYLSNTRRAETSILASNRRGQSNLWAYSISGDLPIVVLRIEDAANIDFVQQLIQAQAYWRHKGLVVDLVILNEERMGYRQNLQDKIMSLITSNTSTDHTVNIIARVAEQIPLEDRILLQSVARVVLSDTRGTLKEQLGRRRISPPVMPALSPHKSPRNIIPHTLEPLPQDLQFFNGLGGYAGKGDEYLIRLDAEITTPAPWANVLANPHFGTLVSESGQAYTWIDNAHEFRLTPWDNDPLKDSAGEAFYLRDDETGYSWSPTVLPCRGNGDYQIRHGFGYSIFEHTEDGIHSEVWMYVAVDDPIKFVVLKLRNDSMHRRRLSATGYVTWVLGDLRVKNAMHVITELSSTGALLAKNYYNTEFGERTAFFDAATHHQELISRTVTGDRSEFIGRNGTLHQPAALKRKWLSGRVGAGLDPCGAIQFTFNLAEGETREIVFILGAGKDKENAEVLIQRYHGINVAQTALVSVRQHWQQLVNVIQVSTPDPALNLLANGWLLYQVLSSRLWGRTGYYQSGGAFGFRDQLQDVMALANVAPTLFRDHLLLCAAHQFEAGDVQHWWHPPANRGVRTRCSDDYLWLPFALCRYIETTGDLTILDEKVPFLQGRTLKADEESYYELPMIGTEAITLYQHAVRAINNGLKFGAHGLPLMGSGDWNDGMNLVGVGGRGESVWLGFFLYSVLKHFAPLAARYGDTAFASQCEAENSKLQQQLEEHGWDGEWYRRAYFDDGTPLGSASNKECRIDSIAQSWAVLSGAANSARAKQAMGSLQHYLVSKTDGLIKLLDPPFDKSIPNPGYIEGYVPGIRENGGQYTHAAIWAAMAFARLDEKDLSWQLFQILNPINHGRTESEINRYKIEPYVVAGDVYSVAPHTGRGGWSWYTGSAGWLYRLITETLLGVKLEAGKMLQLTPLLPHDWTGFNLDYTYGQSVYKIVVEHTKGKTELLLDQVTLTENVITLVDDGKSHQINLRLNNLP